MSISIHSFSILKEKRQTRIIEARTKADRPKGVKMQVIGKEIDEKEEGMTNIYSNLDRQRRRKKQIIWTEDGTITSVWHLGLLCRLKKSRNFNYIGF